MDSDEDHDHEHDEPDGGSANSTALTGFLFGNIDKEGKLEDDVLDEESKRHLGSLTSLGIGSMVREITKDESGEDNSSTETSGSEMSQEKASDAVDYSDITEVAEEEESEKYKDALASMRPPSSDEGDDYDSTENDQKSLMPPPSWIPEPKTLKNEVGKKESDKPLAALLPPQFKDVDVKELFPEFRTGQVLRFSRLFKPVYSSHIWKKKKRKKPEGEQDGEKEKSSKEAEGDLPAGDGDGSRIDVGEKIQDDCPIKLDMGHVPRPEEIATDDLDLFLRTTTSEDKNKSTDLNETEAKAEIPAWRYGPAQLWYDLIGVDETGEGFDYGFKLKKEKEQEEAVNSLKEEEVKPEVLETPAPSPAKFPRIEYPYDAYLMITQLPWEEEIIWNGEEVKNKIMSTLKQRGTAAGWLPCSSIRTAAQFDAHFNLSGKAQPQVQGFTRFGEPIEQVSPKKEEFSMFPIENEELVYSRWEDKVIWDASQMDNIPMPSSLVLDPNDENIVLEIPDDRDPNDEQTGTTDSQKKKEKRRSTILLGKQGIIKEDDEEEEEEETVVNKDPFNLSNDEYYNPRLANDTALKANLGITLLQHSTPAVELRQPFFPTHLTAMKLRNFHRNPLKKYSHGLMSGHGPQQVFPLLKQIKRKAKLREQERMASGGGDMFFMRSAEDLTGKDGELILAEFSEEFPPLINQVGMATKIKNYYKRKPGKDSNPPTFEWGELAYSHSSPFLGSMNPGQCIQAFENKMYRAPIYQHKLPDTDFLIIRNRQHFYIRDLSLIYTVGQLCPLEEVPGPNSKKANNFMRDFLQVFIYRLFWKSKDNPRRIKMDVIKKAFPSHSESMIRKRLKPCADFKRTGVDSNWWVIKPEFRLPSEEEMRAMVSPEQCCAYYTMLAAKQKLEDAGYGEKSLIFTPEGDEDEESGVKIDDEILSAPWNTTRAYISAMKGRCLLGLTGVADPTGCGEGFSYVKVPNKPAQPKDEEKKDTPIKKTVTGTDADLRRLPLKDAKALLRNFGVPEHEIKKLSRWEVIDVVRTMSTEQAKAGQEGMSKFARGNRFSVAEHQERYKEECQRVFDLQNKVLASNEVLSTDDEDTDEEDSDFDELGKNLENMLSNKKTSSQLSLEREEAERRDLLKMIRETPKKKSKDESADSPALPPGTRKLKITRTFKDENGKLYTRTETVTKPMVIDTYVRIRQTKNDEIIKQLFTLDDAQKEEMKKERRRLQEQLRRIKKNEEKGKQRDVYKPSKDKRKLVAPVKTNLKCGACGGIGHMRTNKECPVYAKTAQEAPTKAPAIKVAITEEQEEELHKKELAEEDDDMINVEGTKVKISKALVERAEMIKRKSLVLKFPKTAMEGKKRRRAGTVVHCDYLKERKKTSNRRRADPVVSMSSIFESILNEMRELPDAEPFRTPVNPKVLPNYYTIIKKPMDLQTIRDNIRNRRYLSRQAFIMDVNVMVKNSAQYNGLKSVLTVTSQRMLDLCLQRVAEKEEKLMRLEKAINPLLDDNDLVAINFIFKNIVLERMKTVENSWPFHKPVNKKQVKDYYEIIKEPMDMELLVKNTNKQKYHNREQFLSDVELILDNCVQYNGKDSAYTSTAQTIVDNARLAIGEQEETLEQLERNIKAAQEAALEAAETDSVVTGTSATGGQEGDVDAQSVTSLGAGENITIAEDSEISMRPDENLDFSGQLPRGGTDGRDEFVDIEGDEEDESAQATRAVLDTSLVQDLQLSPENSDDEEHRPQASRLSSSGSDSETEMKEELYSLPGGEAEAAAPGDEAQPMDTYDENAQDCYTESATEAAIQYDEQEDDSFDANAFFKSIGQGVQGESSSAAEGSVAPIGADINNDLHLSESDNDDDFVPVDDDQSQSNFDMNEFFKPN